MTYGYEPDGFGGFKPALSLKPFGNWKKLFGKSKKAPAEDVEPPVAAIEPGAISQQQMILLGVAGLGLVLIMAAGRK